MAEHVPRRKFLGLVAASGAALAAASTAEAREPRGYVGIVTAASARGIEIETNDGALRVTPARGARLFSGASGPVTSTAAFVPGDRVACEGARVGSSVRATAIGSILTKDEARGMVWRHPHTGAKRIVVEARSSTEAC